jgi:hypothetical protein
VVNTNSALHCAALDSRISDSAIKGRIFHHAHQAAGKHSIHQHIMSTSEHGEDQTSHSTVQHQTEAESPTVPAKDANFVTPQTKTDRSVSMALSRSMAQTMHLGSSLLEHRKPPFQASQE